MSMGIEESIQHRQQVMEQLYSRQYVNQFDKRWDTTGHDGSQEES